MIKGIDVSSYQGIVDWDKVKADGVEFAIIRCGIGDDIESQDDTQFERNWAECERLNIPHTVYLFSYGVTKEHIDSEVAHIKRLLSGKNITAPVYIDVENTKGLDWRTLSNDEMLALMQYYCSKLAELGYKMGIYSSRSAFWNEKMTDPWYENVSKWVAEYGDKVNSFNRKYDIWQHTSKGQINGINGNVDLNILVGNIYDLTKKVNVFYRAKVGGKWLPEVKNTEDYAGIKGKSITDIAIKVDCGSVKYRVHNVGGDWLPYVTGYDISESVNGYAGCGKPIDLIEVYYFTPDNLRPYQYAIYRVSPVLSEYYSWQIDNKTTNNMDGYAGLKGKAIDRFQIQIGEI